MHAVSAGRFVLIALAALSAGSIGRAEARLFWKRKAGGLSVQQRLSARSIFAGARQKKSEAAQKQAAEQEQAKRLAEEKKTRDKQIRAKLAAYRKDKDLRRALRETGGSIVFHLQEKELGLEGAYNSGQYWQQPVWRSIGLDGHGIVIRTAQPHFPNLYDFAWRTDTTQYQRDRGIGLHRAGSSERRLRWYQQVPTKDLELERIDAAVAAWLKDPAKKGLDATAAHAAHEAEQRSRAEAEGAQATREARARREHQQSRSRTSPERSYYVELGVPESATAADLKAAYYKLAKAYHPDATGGDPVKAEAFKAIARAYQILSDPVRRATYDALGR
jgi:hypothetical protein